MASTRIFVPGPHRLKTSSWTRSISFRPNQRIPEPSNIGCIFGELRRKSLRIPRVPGRAEALKEPSRRISKFTAHRSSPLFWHNGCAGSLEGAAPAEPSTHTAPRSRRGSHPNRMSTGSPTGATGLTCPVLGPFSTTKTYWQLSSQSAPWQKGQTANHVRGAEEPVDLRCARRAPTPRNPREGG
jgi:hypothetical protein